MNNNYNFLSTEQLDLAYEYYLKEIIKLLDKSQNSGFLLSTQEKAMAHHLFSEINKIRKVQKKQPIFITKIYMGSLSVYLKFF